MTNSLLFRIPCPICATPFEVDVVEIMKETFEVSARETYGKQEDGTVVYPTVPCKCLKCEGEISLMLVVAGMATRDVRRIGKQIKYETPKGRRSQFEMLDGGKDDGSA